MNRQDWTIVALAIGIVALLAFGCVRNTSKERVWRNGEWQDKHPKHDNRTDHFGR